MVGGRENRVGKERENLAERSFRVRRDVDLVRDKEGEDLE